MDKKMAVSADTAKFREETSKKAGTAVNDRVAAMHKLGNAAVRCKHFFAPQHCVCVASA
jgi:hypothetical protein